jgi:porin
MHRISAAALAICAAVLTSSPVYAECGSACDECGECHAPCWADGLLGQRSLIGDWQGRRSALAESGITFTGNATQFYSGVTRGGQRTGWRYGGHNDYILDIDMDKAVGLKGNFIKLRAEHRYGENINELTGAILPANLAASLPVPDSENIYLTNVLFTQFLSESCGVYFGKLDTLDGDMNAFAHGRGKDQFLNTSLVTNPALLRVVPYSTLGAGLVLIPGEDSIVNIGVLNATDTVRTSGFDELFNEGAVVMAEGRFRTNFLGKPGHQLIGGAWNSRDFTSLQQDPRILFPPAGVPIGRQTSSWGIFYNFDQYLVTDSCDPSKGWGVFGRYGITDGNPNPIDWFVSFGLGGNSPINGRSNDTWGLGWHMNAISDELGPVATAFLGVGDGQGVELFYNCEVTPRFHVTSDIQYIHPSARNRADDAVAVGFRAKIDL